MSRPLAVSGVIYSLARHHQHQGFVTDLCIRSPQSDSLETVRKWSLGIDLLLFRQNEFKNKDRMLQKSVFFPG